MKNMNLSSSFNCIIYIQSVLSHLMNLTWQKPLHSLLQDCIFHDWQIYPFGFDNMPKIDQVPVCGYWLRRPAADQWRGRQWRHGPDLGTSLPSSGHRAVRPRARVRSLTWTAVMNSGLRPPDVLTQVKPFMQGENCGSYKYFGCQIFWNPRIMIYFPPDFVF